MWVPGNAVDKNRGVSNYESPCTCTKTSKGVDTLRPATEKAQQPKCVDTQRGESIC